MDNIVEQELSAVAEMGDGLATLELPSKSLGLVLKKLNEQNKSKQRRNKMAKSTQKANIKIQGNLKPKPTVKCKNRSQCTKVTDRQTDRQGRQTTDR